MWTVNGSDWSGVIETGLFLVNLIRIRRIFPQYKLCLFTLALCATTKKHDDTLLRHKITRWGIIFGGMVFVLGSSAIYRFLMWCIMSFFSMMMFQPRMHACSCVTLRDAILSLISTNYTMIQTPPIFILFSFEWIHSPFERRFAICFSWHVMHMYSVSNYE